VDPSSTDASHDAGVAVTGSDPVVLPKSDRSEAPESGATVAVVGRWQAVRERASHLRPAWKALIAFAIYQLIAIAILVVPILPRFTTQHIGGGLNDSRYFQWAMTWTPWALLHGLNPLQNGYLFAPDGTSMAWSTFVPGPAIVMWPITSLFGPMTSVNTLVAVSPALAGWAAYLVCNRLTKRFWPSLAGGFLFGFSSYLVVNTIGFINLVLVFPLPLLVYLVIRRVEGSLGPVAFVAWFAVLLVGLFSISTEVFGTSAIFLGIAYALALAMGTQIRRRLLATGGLILVAGAIAAAVLSPYLLAVMTNAPEQALRAPERLPAADLLSFIVPTRRSAVGGAAFQQFVATHVLRGTAAQAYMGVGVLAMLVGFALTERRRRETWALLGFILFVAAMTMGPVLHIGSVEKGAGPQQLLAKLPWIQSAQPARYAVYSALAVAVVAALWLVHAVGRFAWVRWAVVAFAALLLVPASMHHRPPVYYPPFFSSDAIARVIQPGENVYVVGGMRGDELVWQLAADYRFRLAQAYVGPLIHEMRDGPLALGLNVTETHAPPPPDEIASWMQEHQVAAVIMDDRAASTYRLVLGQAGLEQVYAGEGVTVWRPAGGAWPSVTG
jgi:hypothetical protein